MKAASAKEIKDELQHQSEAELLKICLRLSRFKKENKELLTYLLFEAGDEAGYVDTIKAYVEEEFENLKSTYSYYFLNKGIRKILRNLKKYIRYSGKKETDVVLLLFFCQQLKDLKPSIDRSRTLTALYERQLGYIEKKITQLHEDLQYDYGQELEALQPE